MGWVRLDELTGKVVLSLPSRVWVWLPVIEIMVETAELAVIQVSVI